MKLTVATVLACFVLALALSAESATAADAKKVTTDSKAVIAGSNGVAELAAPATQPVNPPEPPKPPRSVKNPNDDKDEDPGDGNAGGGNDNPPGGGGGKPEGN